jgi:hypothetical protein
MRTNGILTVISLRSLLFLWLQATVVINWLTNRNPFRILICKVALNSVNMFSSQNVNGAVS